MQETMLDEVFAKPSNEEVKDRFSDAQAADCSGSCSSGICRRVV